MMKVTRYLIVDPVTGDARTTKRRPKPWWGEIVYRLHINGLFGFDENTSPEDAKRMAYIRYHNNQWLLVNEGITALIDISNEKTPKPVPVGSYVRLQDGLMLSFGQENGARKTRVSLLRAN